MTIKDSYPVFKTYASRERHLIGLGHLIIDAVSSNTVSLTTQQDSVQGPILFLIYIRLHSEIMWNHSISRYGYAEDTQIYTIFSVKETSGQQTALKNLEQYISVIRNCLIQNKLKINDGNTEMSVFTTPGHNKRILHGNSQLKIGPGIKMSKSNYPHLFEILVLIFTAMCMVPSVNDVAKTCIIIFDALVEYDVIQIQFRVPKSFILLLHPAKTSIIVY